MFSIYCYYINNPNNIIMIISMIIDFHCNLKSYGGGGPFAFVLFDFYKKNSAPPPYISYPTIIMIGCLFAPSKTKVKTLNISMPRKQVDDEIHPNVVAAVVTYSCTVRVN